MEAQRARFVLLTSLTFIIAGYTPAVGSAPAPVTAAVTTTEGIPQTFGGPVVATGSTFYIACVWFETWDLDIVVSLLGNTGSVRLSGTKTSVPQPPACLEYNIPVELVFDLSVSGPADEVIQGSYSTPFCGEGCGQYLLDITGTRSGTTISGSLSILAVGLGESGGQQGSFVLNECVVEICDDGLDNDCDGQTDEDVTWYPDSDGDSYGDDQASGFQDCEQPLGYVSDNTDCDDTRSDVNPGESEVCEGVDNDCDDSIDETFDADGDTYTTCGDVSNMRTNGLPGGLDCDDTKSAVNPEGTEECNDVDDDCDGSVDDGNPQGGFSCGTLQPGVCALGTTVCSGGSLTCVATVGPSAEVCDALDNDCDGSVDDGNPGGGFACATGQPGVCAAGTTVCSSGSVSCIQNVQPAAEICDALDNDCDGALDEGGVCPLMTSLSPARVWVGLQNDTDSGIRFDLAARVYLNDVEVGSGQLDSVPGGSSGFDNAKLDTIRLSLFAPVPVAPGSSFRIELLVRNACRGSGKESGQATLWYNGQPTDHGPRKDAGSRFDARIGGGAKRDYFLREPAALSTTPGSSRLSVNQDAGSPCSDLKSLGTWTTTLP